MISPLTKIVIVGAGLAGMTVANALRSNGFPGTLLLLGDEPHGPYDRPPLSKAFLKGELEIGRLMLRPERFYVEKQIDLRPNVSVTRLNTKEKWVELGECGRESFDFLVIATGSRPRDLNILGGDLRGVHHLRTLSDSSAVGSALRPGATIALVGGGYIGLEVAAVATERGASAVVFERELKPLSRIASALVSDFYSDQHKRRGVTIVADAQVSEIVGCRDQVSSVRLVNGQQYDCTAVLLCAGGIPNDEIASTAGLECDNGVVVDNEGRSSDPAVFAIGDVSKRPLPFSEYRMHRLESVSNAIEQAMKVSAAILGREKPNEEVPWFWSNQFDIKLKIAGLPLGANRQIVRGDPSTGRFSVMHLKDGLLVCIEAVNSAADFVAGKTLIGQRTVIDPAKAQDPSIPLILSSMAASTSRSSFAGE